MTEQQPNRKREYWTMSIFTLAFLGLSIGLMIQRKEYAGQMLAFAAVPTSLLFLWAAMLWRMRARLAANKGLFGVLAVLGLAAVAGATGLAAWQFLFV